MNNISLKGLIIQISKLLEKLDVEFEFHHELFSLEYSDNSSKKKDGNRNSDGASLSILLIQGANLHFLWSIS